MTFILRWPAVLVLFALVGACVLAALGAAGIITGYEAPVAQVQEAQAQAAATGAADATWLDVGLLAGAGVFFLIAAIRLIRRTQGFWVWLLGFALYAGRWAYAQGDGVVDKLKAIDINVYRDPQALVADMGSFEAQVGVLAVILVVGAIVAIVDGADRAYWDKQGA
jgi:multisubunit Na+/H+ antiporter MnhC subunit